MLWFIVLLFCSIINLIFAADSYNNNEKLLCLFGGFASGFCFVSALANLFL
ncbi:MAG: hypothetical protein ACOCZ5_02635 [bacterium]